MGLNLFLDGPTIMNFDTRRGKMNVLICPDCQKPLMSMKKAEKLLQTTTSKTLMSRCWCGVAYAVRSLRKNTLDIFTSSGKRSAQFIKEDQSQIG